MATIARIRAVVIVRCNCAALRALVDGKVSSQWPGVLAVDAVVVFAAAPMEGSVMGLFAGATKEPRSHHPASDRNYRFTALPTLGEVAAVQRPLAVEHVAAAG